MISLPRYLFIHDADADPSALRDPIVRQWKEMDRGVDYDFYAASCPEDALRHVSLYCDLHPELDTCFVACGRDALTAGVAAGLMGADEGKTLAVYDPEGTNSLARYYEGRDFGSIPLLLAGSPTGIDMIRINNSYAVNSCTFGLEDLTGEKGSGLLQSVSTSLRRSFRSVRISADGAPLDAGSILLFTLANGRYAPGGLLCAPSASNDDGRMDLCIVRNMAPTRLMKVLPLLAGGGLAEEPSLASDTVLRKVRTLTVESSKDITLMADGIALTGREFSIRLVPSAVRIVIPAVQD